jgi:HK97 gp10 family phage protein
MEGIQLNGVSETKEALRALDTKVQKSLIRKALRAGSKIVLAQAKANAPSNTGNLRSNLRIRSGKAKKGTIALTVGASAKGFKGHGNKNAFYLSFVEYGYRTRPRISKEHGKAPGGRRQVEGQHFIERAYESEKETAVETMTDTLIDLIQQEATKS